MAQIPNEERRTLILTGATRGIGHVRRLACDFCSRHPFPEDCPWEAGPDDHIQVDLGDADNTSSSLPR
jgi:hypothetical protein